MVGECKRANAGNERDKMSTGEKLAPRDAHPCLPPTLLEEKVILSPEPCSVSLGKFQSPAVSPTGCPLLTHLDKSLFQSLSLQLHAYSTSTNLLFALIVKHFKGGKLGALLTGEKRWGRGYHYPSKQKNEQELLPKDIS